MPSSYQMDRSPLGHSAYLPEQTVDCPREGDNYTSDSPNTQYTTPAGTDWSTDVRRKDVTAEQKPLGGGYR